MEPSAPKVLLVSDEPSLVAALSILFTRLGYWVDSAEGVEAGIRMLHRCRPTVVVSELRMRFETGLGLLGAAREADASLPVILLTSRHDLNVAIEALRLGAFACIRKPFVNRELVTKVKEALRSRDRLPPILQAPARVEGRNARVPCASPSLEFIERAYEKWKRERHGR